MTGEFFSVKVPTVVVATGSYPAAKGRLHGLLGEAGRYMVTRANPFSDGFALELAERLGLSIAGPQDRFYGHLVPYGVDILPQDFGPITLNCSEFGVLVDRAGRRFTDESRGDWSNAEAVARLAGGLAFLIMDHAMVERARLTPRFPGAPRVDILANLRERQVPLAEAGDLKDLATKLAALAGTPGQPPPAQLERLPLKHPPFVGLVVVPGITFGKMGLCADEQLRVCSRRGAVVDGIYAAGVDIGGVFGDSYAGALALALTTGRQAGRKAAAFALSAGRLS